MDFKDYESKFFQSIDQLNAGSACMGILYALTDIDVLNYDDLVGKKWVCRESNRYLVNLDFIAVRLLRYHLEIVDSDISYTSPKTSDLENTEQSIFEIIRKHGEYGLAPDISTLATDNSQKTKTLLDEVVRIHMRPDILKHIADSFDGVEYNERNQIILDIRLVEFFGKNRHTIRGRIEAITSDHLKRVYGKGGITSKTIISANSPFYGYFSKHTSLVQVFLIGVESKNAVQSYQKTVEVGIHANTINLNDAGKTVHFWGIRSTVDNKAVWEQIDSGDLVLFCHKKWCFSKARIRKTVQDAQVTGTVGSYAGEGTARDLLLILEDVVPFDMDLENSRTPLINPTMPHEYRFPIKRVDSEKIQYLHDAYGDVESGLVEISENENILTGADNLVELLQGQATVRKGQQRFRDAVLDNFHHKCAVCDIDMDSLLEASHILGIRNVKASGRTDNGICLCVLHHRMFDRGYLYFDDDYHVCISKSVSDYLKNSCTTLHISRSDCHVMPSRKYLRLHRANSGLRMQVHGSD